MAEIGFDHAVIGNVSSGKHGRAAGRDFDRALVDDTGVWVIRRDAEIVIAREEITVANIRRCRDETADIDPAPWPNRMPLPLMSQTWPLANTLPSIAEAPAPITRFSVMDPRSGC
jgi:hypothetical protein